MKTRSGRGYQALSRTIMPLTTAFLASRGLRRATNTRYRSIGTMTGTRTRNRVRSGGGVTTQYDKKNIYRRRNMPYRKKRRWRRFVKKVLSVSEKDLGSRTVVRNNLVQTDFDLNLTNQERQAATVVGLYPNEDAGLAAMNDMRQLRNDSDIGTTGKMIFHSGIFDMTVSNTSYREEGSINRNIKLEVDVYEITAGREFTVPGLARTLFGVFDEGSNATATIPGRTTALTRNDRGWSPWDFPSAISQYRLRILKKTKYIIGEGETFTYQIRDPKRHVIDRQSLSLDGQNIPGMTRFVYLLWKPVAGLEYTDTIPDTAQLSCGVTRKYLYKVNQSTQDYDTYQQ